MTAPTLRSAVAALPVPACPACHHAPETTECEGGWDCGCTHCDELTTELQLQPTAEAAVLAWTALVADYLEDLADDTCRKCGGRGDDGSGMREGERCRSCFGTGERNARRVA